jgi:uncharacterized membrane protein YkoI
MKIKAMLAILFSMVLVFGLNTSANAQTDTSKDDKPKVQKDDDGEDEKILPKDRKKIKITIEQARKTALERVSGTIVEEEIEKEDGKLVYSIEIKDAGGKVFDVEVNAATGAIHKVEEEDDDGEDDNDAKTTKPPQ